MSRWIGRRARRLDQFTDPDASGLTPAMEGNTVKLRTYHAFSMSQALAAVRNDLGADAIILQTRTFKRSAWFGLWRRTIVEVTATTADHSAVRPEPRSTALPPRVQLKSVQAQRAYTGAARTGPTAQPATRQPQPAVLTIQPTPAIAESDRDRTRRLAKAMEEAHRRTNPPSIAPATVEPKPENSSPRRASAAGKCASPPARAAKRFLLTTADAMSRGLTVDGRSQKSEVRGQHSSLSTPHSASNDPWRDELTAIKSMVGQVLQRQSDQNVDAAPQSTGVDATMPQQLFDMYLKLIAQDLSDELADRVINAVRAELDDEAMNDETKLRVAVMRHLAAIVPVAAEPVIAQPPLDGRPLTIALIGPTGVGKTTTLAKLAATFKLRHGKTVGLITADTYRIAAVDQLRTYADIIDVPLHIACTPAEMKRAVAALHDRDVILIDTAGRSQKDSARLAELKRFIAAADPHEVHLVLSGTAGEKTLLQEAEAFSRIGLPTAGAGEQGVHKIVLTKLDEAVSFGMLISVVSRIGKQLSFVTTGQEVPDDIEPAPGIADRLAAMVVGEPVRVLSAAG